MNSKLLLLLLLLLPSTCNADNISSLSKDLVISAHFSEGQGTLTENSTKITTSGVLENGASWASGKFGQGLYFPNSGGLEKVKFPFTSLYNSQFVTVSIWFWYQPNNATGSFLFSKGGGGEPPSDLYCYVSATQFVVVGVNINDGNCATENNQESAGTTKVKGRQWNHLVVRMKDKEIVTFLNGQKEIITPLAQSPCMANTTIPVRIGNHNGSGAWCWKGYLDDFGYWRRGLEDGECKQLYAIGKPSHSN